MTPICPIRPHGEGKLIATDQILGGGGGEPAPNHTNTKPNQHQENTKPNQRFIVIDVVI